MSMSRFAHSHEITLKRLIKEAHFRVADVVLKLDI